MFENEDEEIAKKILNQDIEGLDDDDSNVFKSKIETIRQCKFI